MSDAEIVQISNQGGCVFEGETCVELQPIGGLGQVLAKSDTARRFSNKFFGTVHERCHLIEERLKVLPWVTNDANDLGRFFGLFRHGLGNEEHGGVAQQVPILFGLGAVEAAPAIARIFARPVHLPALIFGRCQQGFGSGSRWRSLPKFTINRRSEAFAPK